jgi:hypothetical protein
VLELLIVPPGCPAANRTRSAGPRIRIGSPSWNRTTWSNLHAALCASPYQPGRIERTELLFNLLIATQPGCRNYLSCEVSRRLQCNVRFRG